MQLLSGAAFNLLKDLSLAGHTGLHFRKTLQESVPLRLIPCQILTKVVAGGVKGSPGKRHTRLLLVSALSTLQFLVARHLDAVQTTENAKIAGRCSHHATIMDAQR